MRKSTGTTVPDHLNDLYEGAACGLNQSEKEQIARLLSQFEDTFSRDEWDLGLTTL